MREGFRYYELSLSQLLLNRWMTLSVFDKFFRFVKIEPTINVFKICYNLVVDIDDDNGMCWFFTLINKPIKAMKGALQGKPLRVKK